MLLRGYKYDKITPKQQKKKKEKKSDFCETEINET